MSTPALRSSLAGVVVGLAVIAAGSAAAQEGAVAPAPAAAAAPAPAPSAAPPVNPETVAAAATIATEVARVAAATEAVAKTNEAAADPSGSSQVAPAGPALFFQATTAEKIAKVRLGRVVEVGSIGSLNPSVTISGPVDSSGGPTTLANLDGLANAATVEVQLKWLGWNPRPVASRMSEVCEKYLKTRNCTRLALPSDEAKRELDAVVEYGTPVIAALSGQLGRQRFAWLDADTLAKSKEDRTPWSVKAALGYVATDVGYVGLAYRHEVGYEAGTKTQVCTPVGTTGATRCDAGVIGAPKESAKNIGTVEGRLFWKHAAVNPRVSYDFDDDVLGLELPIYLTEDAGTGFNAGVSFGWRSDVREATAMLFVGDSFELFPK